MFNIMHLKSTLQYLACRVPLAGLALASLTLSAPRTFGGVEHAEEDAFLAEAALLMPEILIEEVLAVPVADRPILGDWGPVISWPHVAVSAANLPDGRVLTWASNQRTSFPAGPEFTYAATWDPVTGEIVEINNDNHDMFCAHLVMLGDGRVFANGGRNTVRSTTTFDYQTNSWQRVDDMNDPRWYPTTLALPDGDAVTFSGSGGRNTVERWDENLGWQRLSIDWSSVADAAGFESHWWPYTFLAPDGNIFHAGPTDAMHWIDPDGGGSMTSAGLNVPGTTYPKHGAVAMYGPGKLMIAGGAADVNGGSTETAYTVDLNFSTPVIEVVNSMDNPRRFANGVMLPNGELLVVGGNTSGLKFNDTGTVLTPEIWNPETGLWSPGADMSVPRNYHSVALLLADGRVLSAGGGLCGCAADHQDAQIYTPPYLFAADGSLAPRPEITSGPESIGQGEVFSINATTGMQKFSLIRMVATTHGLTTDNRYLDLSFTEDSTGSYSVTAFNNPNVMTPGFWMLFALDSSGVPSEAHILQVKPPFKLVNPGNQTNGIGDSVSIQLTVSDVGAVVDSYSATGLPSGVSLDSVTGLISGTIADTGVFNVSITAVSGVESDTINFDWVVGTGQGNLLREWWNGIGGTAVSDLTTNPRYPDSPDGSELITTFETPTNIAEDYGTRVSGYIHAPVTGDYTFWIASDDNGELWLSSDDDPANVTRIAHVPGWTSSRQWFKYSEQQSVPITLVAGQKYYVDALFKERGGGDNLAVSWQYPGQSQVVIDGAHLSLYSPTVNTAPVLAGIGSQSGTRFDSVSLAVSASDTDGDALVYSANGLPSGLSIDSASGLITGTLLAVGNFSPTVTVDDGNGGSDSVSFSWTVSEGGTPPIGSITREWWLGISGSNVSDLTSNSAYPDSPDGAELLPRLEGPTDWVDNYGARVRGFLHPSVTGNYTFWIASDDGGELWLSDDHTAEGLSLIANVPGWSSPREWDKFPEQQSATIPLEAGRVYYIEVLHKEGGVLDNLAVAWAYPGSSQAVIEGAFLSPYGEINNQSPSIVNPGTQTGTVGDLVSLQLSASDPDGDSLVYSATDLPDGLTLGSTSGLISGTLGSDRPFFVTVTVIDGKGGSDSVSFDWIVDPLPPVNTPPVVTNPGNQIGMVGDSISLPVVASDGDDDTLTFAATGLPNGLSIDSSSGVVSGIAGLDGVFSVTVTVDDGNGGTDSASFDWVIDPLPPQNVPPVLTNPGHQSSTVGDSISLTMEASDGNNDVLAFTSSGLPSGLSMDSVSGLISGILEAEGGFDVTVSVEDGRGGSDSESFTWTVDPLPPVNNPPVLTHPGNQTGTEGDAVILAIDAADGDGDTLTFAATGLPDGLSINAGSGQIAGSLDLEGTFSVTVSVDDGNGGSDSVNFDWQVDPMPNRAPILTNPGDQLSLAGSSVTMSLVASDEDEDPLTFNAVGLPSGLSIVQSNGSIFGEVVSVGTFDVTVSVDDGQGGSDSHTISWVVDPPEGDGSLGNPVSSSSIVYQTVENGNDRVWVANPDNDTVTVVDVVADSVLAEIAVGDSPRTLALSPDDTVWVVNQRSNSISIIDTTSLIVVDTIPMDYGSQPYGIVIDRLSGDAYVSLSAAGLIVKLDILGNILIKAPVSPNLRSLSLSDDGSTLYATQFVSIPQTGESGLIVDPVEGADVFKFSAATLDLLSLIPLQHNDVVDGHLTGRGIPNYLGPLVLSPLGTTGWVASKQDNLMRGGSRDGNDLTHDTTVRSITSKVDLGLDSEVHSARVDHDNGGVARAAAFGPLGNYLYVALEGSREVVMLNAFASAPIVAQVNRFDVGRAPQGVVVSPDGDTLFVHNFMDRTVTKHDVSQARVSLLATVTLEATYNLVSSEALAPEVLNGKQLFYDAADPRIALEGYISCASCHFDGEQDGRVWDLTNMGQGIRNTTTLRGKAGLGHGSLHWSANFDEVQDFEVQIRNLGGGTGLIDGPVNDPLGAPNAGLSADLDALAAYLTSLTEEAPSPYRQSDGSLTPDGEAGKLIFQAQNCVQCHSGPAFTDSIYGLKHDIGTSGPGSGSALDEGVDTPTLRGVWATAPYLHNGSAHTLEEAIAAHAGVSLSPSELNLLAAYLQQIDDQEMPEVEPLLLHGRVSVRQSNSNQWHVLTFAEPFTQTPIVVMGPPSYNGSHQSTMRVRNVTTTGFEYQIDEWDYRDGAHTTETISFLAIEPGVHDLNGITMVGGSVTVNHNWQTPSFSEPFGSTPIVLSQIVTANEASAATVRQRNVNGASFQLKVDEEEGNDRVHSFETVHYVALSIGSGELNGQPIRTGTTGKTVDERWDTVPFGSSFSNPDILATMQTTAGGDTAALRYRNLNASSVQIKVEEEQSANSETGHVNEEVGWLVIGNE